MTTVSFAQPYAAAPIVVLTPANATTAALGIYLSSTSTTGFTVGVTATPAAAQPTGTYLVNFIVLAIPR